MAAPPGRIFFKVCAQFLFLDKLVCQILIDLSRARFRGGLSGLEPRAPTFWGPPHNWILIVKLL